MHFAFNNYTGGRLLCSSRSSWSLFSGASELPMYENVMDIKFYAWLPCNYYGNLPINQYFSYIRFMFMNWSRKYACARWVFFLVARFLGTSFFLLHTIRNTYLNLNLPETLTPCGIHSLEHNCTGWWKWPKLVQVLIKLYELHHTIFIANCIKVVEKY